MWRTAKAAVFTCAPPHLPCPPSARSTEPHSDEYYQHDIEADMRAAGLQHVNTVESDPRHRVVVRGLVVGLVLKEQQVGGCALDRLPAL